MPCPSVRSFIVGLSCVCLGSLSSIGFTQDSLPQLHVQGQPKIGLVLSGGGARGFAHIGVLKALEELRIPIHCVAGTSMGAMIGGGFAAGLNSNDIENITLKVDWDRMFANTFERSRNSNFRKEQNRKGLSDIALGIDDTGVHLSTEVMPSQELELFIGRVTLPTSNIHNLDELNIPFAALATDLETGAPVVLQKNITLGQAMRASMSVPGAYAPVQYEGHLLVDGGLVANLPVETAKSMGADVIIAINAGTPLSKKQDLNNWVGVMAQMVNLLTEKGVQKSKSLLTENDVYIVPNLEGYNSTDFKKSRAIIDIGYTAVMAHKEALKRFQLAESDYEQWKLAHHNALPSLTQHRIAEVRFDGLKQVNGERLLAQTSLDISEPVTDEDILQASRDIWSSGDFSKVPYRFETGPNSTEILVFEPEEKSSAFSSIRLGGNLQTDFDKTNQFNLLLSHSFNWINAWGARWTNELQIGEIRQYYSEFYQPLGLSTPWFLMPRLSYKWEPFESYDVHGNSIARARNEIFESSLSLGYEFKHLGRASLGFGWVDKKTQTEISPIPYSDHTNSLISKFEIVFDTLDSFSFPTKGFYLNATAYQSINPHFADGWSNDDEFSFIVNGMWPVAITDRTTALFSGRLDHTPFRGDYSLGGVFNLTGSPYGRFTGDRLALGRVLIYHKLQSKMKLFDSPIYLGSSFEVGRTWRQTPYDSFLPEMNWKRAASIFIGIDSWFGPTYLVAGRTFGESNALIVYWGRLPF